MENLISQLEKFKNSFLVIATIIYSLGLINWSIYAYSNSLGLISVFDTQYFVAGFIPFIILGLMYLTFKSRFIFLDIFRNRTKRFLRKIKTRIKDRLVLIKKGVFLLYVLFGLAYLVYNINYRKKVELDSPDLIFVMTLIVLSLFFLIFKQPLSFIRKLSYKQKRTFVKLRYPRKFFVIYFKSYIVIVVIIILPTYALLIYPEIPQELGGAKPKKCIFQCKKDVFSNAGKNNIFADTTRPIYISKEIYVYFYNNDKIIFKNDDNDNSVYEIKRSDITLLDWLK